MSESESESESESQPEMAVAPEILEIGMLQIGFVLFVFDSPSEEASEWILTKFLADIEPKVQQIFKHYDTAEPQGSWSPEEAAIFLGHYAENYPHILVALATKEMAAKAFLKIMLSAVEVDDKANTPEAEATRKEIEEGKEEMTKAMNEDKEKTREGMTKQLLSYQENKKARNEEAFKFLDANGDQKIDLSELMAAMQPNNEENTQLIGALGLDDGKKPLTKGSGCSASCSIL